MKVNILIIVLLIIGISLKAQNKYGYQWHFTNHNIMDFRNNTLLLDIIQPSPFYNTGNFSSNICDKETGELLFVSGGCYVLNKKFNIIKNGDSINSQLTYTSWCRVNAGDGTFPMYQNNIILPYPDSSSKYFLFNLDFDTINSPKLVLLPFHLYSNIIDISRENGLGEVIEKKKVIINDSLSTGGYLTAVRNKNDKDWWIIVPKWKTNCYFVIPVTSSGVGIPIKQCIGLNWQEIDRGGQVDISPNGTKYSRVNKRDTVMILDFNSGTGQFSNPITLYQPNKESFLQGVCFSQNSRFLYVMHMQKVYQFDLQATDIQGSMQVVGDVSSIQQDGEKGLLQFSKIAPDGKIYISSPFNHRYLSVINRPNCSGKLCDFRPYAIELKFYNWGALPNNPHFILPPANYNCDSINTSTEEIIEKVAIYPNPVTTQITISSNNRFQQFDIIALTGQTMLKGKLMENTTDIDVSTLPEGIYFIKLTNPLTQIRALGKFVLKR